MIKNTEKLISSEGVIRIFDDASETSYDSYAIIWWLEDEPVVAEPYALVHPLSSDSHRRFYNRELPANFKIL